MDDMREKIYQASKKHKEWGMILTDYLARPVAVFLAKYTSFTPNQITIVSFLLGLAGAFFLYQGNLVVGASFAMLYNILDMCDGMVARVKGIHSPWGHWLDGVLGFILFPILIFALVLGMNNYLAFILGMLAIISYPLQYNLVYFYKLEVQKSKEQTSMPGRLEWLRYAYGSSFFYLFLLVAALFNKPFWVLWFWAVFGNLYWVALLVVQYRSISR